MRLLVMLKLKETKGSLVINIVRMELFPQQCPKVSREVTKLQIKIKAELWSLLECQPKFH